MASFKDTKGREWRFPDFTIGHVLKIREKLGVDWYKAIDGDEAEVGKALSNAAVAETILLLLGDAMESAGVTIEDFAGAINHEVRVASTEALVETIMSFFHGPITGKRMAAAIRPAMNQNAAKIAQALKSQFGDLPVSQAA